MNTLCIIRDIYRALDCFEAEFEKVHSVCLNQAMALCSLTDGELSSSEMANRTGMTTSHCSKIIKSIEEKEMIIRSLGTIDKRQMYFRLSPKGRVTLEEMKCKSVEVPEILRPIFDKYCLSSVLAKKDSNTR